jgi:hypothetical protein
LNELSPSLNSIEAKDAEIRAKFPGQKAVSRCESTKDFCWCVTQCASVFAALCDNQEFGSVFMNGTATM